MLLTGEEEGSVGELARFAFAATPALTESVAVLGALAWSAPEEVRAVRDRLAQICAQSRHVLRCAEEVRVGLDRPAPAGITASTVAQMAAALTAVHEVKDAARTISDLWGAFQKVEHAWTEYTMAKTAADQAPDSCATYRAVALALPPFEEYDEERGDGDGDLCAIGYRLGHITCRQVAVQHRTIAGSRRAAEWVIKAAILERGDRETPEGVDVSEVGRARSLRDAHLIAINRWMADQLAIIDEDGHAHSIDAAWGFDPPMRTAR